MDKLLKGRTALITGCDTGIGRKICNVFVDEGAIEGEKYNWHETDYTTITDFIETASKLSGYDFTKAWSDFMLGNADRYYFNILADYIEETVFDITDKTKIMECIKKIKFENKGRLDILVNNAGYKKDGVIEMIDDENLKKMIDVNVIGTVHMVQCALRLMKKNKYGG